MHNQTDCNEIHHQKPITTSGDLYNLGSPKVVMVVQIVNKGCTNFFYASCDLVCMNFCTSPDYNPLLGLINYVCASYINSVNVHTFIVIKPKPAKLLHSKDCTGDVKCTKLMVKSKISNQQPDGLTIWWKEKDNEVLLRFFSNLRFHTTVSFVQ